MHISILQEILLSYGYVANQAFIETINYKDIINKAVDVKLLHFLVC